MTTPLIRTSEKFNKFKKELASYLDSSIWVDCKFTNCSLSGSEISNAIFTKCHFEDSDLYWSNGFQTTFIDTKFIRCDLRAWFFEARFVRCHFVDCEYGEDALGGATEWGNTITVDCLITGNPLPIVDTDDEPTNPMKPIKMANKK